MENPFSTNGIDEGIHLLQAKMIRNGYGYYSELDGDQAPLALITFSLFDGDVMSCRYFSYLFFLISLFAVFLIARRFGLTVALLAILFISLDVTLLRESRLASIDLLSATFLCLASLFFLIYIEKTDIASLTIASVFFSLSVLSKVIPVFLVAFILFYLFYIKRRTFHGIIATIFIVVPALTLLMAFTPSELINGILLRQANRGFDWYSKGSIILFFLSGIFYFYAFRKWRLKDERIKYILLWAILLFAPIVLQGRTSQHQLAYCAYPFAILAAKAFNDSHTGEKRRILLAVFITVNMSLAGFFIATAPTDLSYSVADIIEDLTDSEDVVISGNPLITVLANRVSPPNLTNVAEFHYPATTAEDIIYWLKQNTTKIVVLYFYLSELPEISSYLTNQSEWQLYDRIQGKGQILFENLTPMFSTDTYLIYTR